LQEDDRRGVAVFREFLGRLAEHAERAAQERALAFHVVLDLGVKVVAGRELDLESVLAEEAVLRGFESAVGVEGGDVAAPEDERHVDGLVSLDLGEEVRPVAGAVRIDVARRGTRLGATDQGEERRTDEREEETVHGCVSLCKERAAVSSCSEWSLSPETTVRL